MTPTTIECVGILLLTALALAFFVVVFVGLAKDGRERKRRRMNDRLTEEAAAIVAALFAYDQIRENQERTSKKEVKDGEDEAL